MPKADAYGAHARQPRCGLPADLAQQQRPGRDDPSARDAAERAERRPRHLHPATRRSCRGTTRRLAGRLTRDGAASNDGSVRSVDASSRLARSTIRSSRSASAHAARAPWLLLPGAWSAVQVGNRPTRVRPGAAGAAASGRVQKRTSSSSGLRRGEVDARSSRRSATRASI